MHQSYDVKHDVKTVFIVFLSSFYNRFFFLYRNHRILLENGLKVTLGVADATRRRRRLHRPGNGKERRRRRRPPTRTHFGTDHCTKLRHGGRSMEHTAARSSDSTAQAPAFPDCWMRMVDADAGEEHELEAT